MQTFRLSEKQEVKIFKQLKSFKTRIANDYKNLCSNSQDCITLLQNALTELKNIDIGNYGDYQPVYYFHKYNVGQFIAHLYLSLNYFLKQHINNNN